MNVQPVARFAKCSFNACLQPVQFLQLSSCSNPTIVPLCGDHGRTAAHLQAGTRVVWAEPLGHISMEEPESSA